MEAASYRMQLRTYIRAYIRTQYVRTYVLHAHALKQAFAAACRARPLRILRKLNQWSRCWEMLGWLFRLSTPLKALRRCILCRNCVTAAARRMERTLSRSECRLSLASGASQARKGSVQGSKMKSKRRRCVLGNAWNNVANSHHA